MLLRQEKQVHASFVNTTGASACAAVSELDEFSCMVSEELPVGFDVLHIASVLETKAQVHMRIQLLSFNLSTYGFYMLGEKS